MAVKQRAALISVGSTIVLATLKLIFAVITGSLAILAEAIQSVLDLAATGITYLVVRIADLPPDENHHYGYARAEHLGALAQMVLMIITAVWVISEAYQRVFGPSEIPNVGFWSISILVVSLVVDWYRSRVLKRVAEQEKSPALAADAANFANDMLSVTVVLISLGLLMILQPLALVPVWVLARLDAFAATIVAIIALTVAWRLGSQAIRALMDDVPPDLHRHLVQKVSNVPNVIPESVQMRTRFVGTQPYVEVTVATPRGCSLEEAHALTESIESVVCAELDGAYVIVHVEPARTPTEPYTTAVYAAAHSLGLSVHNLDVYQLSDRVRVDMDLELPMHMMLGEAHKWSEDLEEAIQKELGDNTIVFVHLEPRRDQVRPAVHYGPLMDELKAIIPQLSYAQAISQFDTLLTDEGIIVTVRHAFPPTMPLREVHTHMADLEAELRQIMPGLLRVQIDPEPVAENVIEIVGETTKL
ncbi:MAG: cation diffusion facilitator family transporter [Chloroflexota bacterium]